MVTEFYWVNWKQFYFILYNLPEKVLGINNYSYLSIEIIVARVLNLAYSLKFYIIEKKQCVKPIPIKDGHILLILFAKTLLVLPYTLIINHISLSAFSLNSYS